MMVPFLALLGEQPACHASACASLADAAIQLARVASSRPERLVLGHEARSPRAAEVLAIARPGGRSDRRRRPCPERALGPTVNPGSCLHQVWHM
jgi:hypothetical protein